MKKMWIVICIIAAAGCLAAGSYIGYYKTNQKKGQAAYEKLQETVKKEETAKEEKAADEETESAKQPEPTELPEASPTPIPTPTDVPPEIPIDFQELKKQNEDIYAWITIEGTNVDYPVLQNPEDDSLYIHHGIDKEYLFAGAIYSEMKNKKDFSDFNTILYGHNMKDGSMFASLHNYRDEEFFKKNREIVVYTPEHIFRYEIFAVYSFDNRHILNSFDFTTEKGRSDYLEEVYNVRSMDAHFLDERKVTGKDKIITLSTCIGRDDSRYLVQGVLTEME